MSIDVNSKAKYNSSQSTIHGCGLIKNYSYPLVNIQRTREHQHFMSRSNSEWPGSIAGRNDHPQSDHPESGAVLQTITVWVRLIMAGWEIPENS